MPKTLWIDTAFNNDLAASTSDRFTLLAQPSQTESRLAGLTLLRTIIGLDIAPTVMDSGEGSIRFDMGIGVAFQEAVTLGVTALPNPADPEDFPPRGWVIRTRYRVWATAADRAVVVWRRVEEDIRARRRLDNGEPFAIFNNNPIEGAGITIRITGWIRQLWLIT